MQNLQYLQRSQNSEFLSCTIASVLTCACLEYTQICPIGCGYKSEIKLPLSGSSLPFLFSLARQKLTSLDLHCSLGDGEHYVISAFYLSILLNAHKFAVLPILSTFRV